MADCGVYYTTPDGTGATTVNRLIPIKVQDGAIFVFPVVANDSDGNRHLVFPGEDTICTYGYNLPVNNYRGRFSDLSYTMFGTTTGSAVSGIAGAITTSRTAIIGAESGGLNIHAGTAEAQFYPTASTETNAKQKIRGNSYTTWDPYLGVEQCDVNSSAWASNVSAIYSGRGMYCYSIDNTGISGQPTVKLKRGWAILSYEKSTDFNLSIGVQQDIVWRPSGSTTTPYYYRASTGRMCLNCPDSNATAVRTWSSSQGFQLYNEDNPNQRFYLIYTGEQNLGTGNLLVSPPKFFVTGFPSSYTVTLNLWQFGWTFGV